MNGMDRVTGKPLSGLAHLRQSVGDILGTPLGTRLCLRDYGSLLPELLDQPMNALTRVQLYAATALALSRQERRLRLTRVGFAATDTPGTFVLTITGTRFISSWSRLSSAHFSSVLHKHTKRRDLNGPCQGLFIERYERLDEEATGIAEDKRDVLSEMKSVGYDTKAFKQIIARRKVEKHILDEDEAVLETYLVSLGMI